MGGETVFLGSKRFGLRTLRALLSVQPVSSVLTVDDRKNPRSFFSEFEEFCAQRKLNLVVVSRQEQVSECLRRDKPERCFVNGWYRILDGEILRQVSGGVFALHGSLLPKLRGGSPLVWTLIQGSPEAGVSLFRMDEGMDTGRVFHQWRFPLEPDDTIADLLRAVESRVSEELPNIWSQIQKGTLMGWEQDHHQATYGGMRTADDGAIDWKKPAAVIHNFVRAQCSPYPGAYTVLGDKKITIQRAVLFPQVYAGTPGQVLSIEAHRVLISCGESTALWLTEVAVNGESKDPSDVFSSLRMRLL